MAMKRINLVVNSCNLHLVRGEIAVGICSASAHRFTHISVKPLGIDSVPQAAAYSITYT